ncbi:ATP-dependent helicase [Actinacidiphila glaucinigra]|uniref:ATP-dependent helicase n=1 Tax=Actinacidiphila glaucinigra TaxID=235986 RepID=UPI002DD7D3BC|nr:ATP-dependent helicase [Actinacidiphila glaucinigra]WSD57464.1 ATP-dependent helicase [Actinacidiphila glaucinigra]WSD65181.1 ATP-dependent helicase [Actinacidiphila glaucinigra]
MTNLEAQRNHALHQQQQAVHAAAPVFVRACPGAGRTRILVDRHCLTPPGPRRAGRALISFTNVAADELRERCSGNRPDLTSFPHYIGTFDSFLWRYLVRPFLPATPPWQHVLSWDQVPSAVVGWGKRKVPLSAFKFTYDPSTRQTLVTWPKPDKYLHNAAMTAEDFIVQAEKKQEFLWQTRGYMTGHELRIAALDHVRNPAVTDLLRERFFEIVVDEAQDCSALDLAILGHLHGADIPLVIVADTDQGIYEWNDARPTDLHTLTSAINNDLELNGNWRSSPPICELAATLRPAPRQTPDLCVGEHHAHTTPVLLLPYGSNRKNPSGLPDAQAASEAFLDRAAEEGIDAADCLAVAYRNSAIPKARSKPAPHLPKEPSTIALAWCAAVFASDDATSTARAHALAMATTFLSAYWYPEADGPVAETLAQRDIPAGLMRRRAGMLLSQLPPVDTSPARIWRSQARAVLKAQLPTPGTELATPTAPYLANADLDKPIRSLIGLLDTPDDEATPTTMRSSSVHQAKGSEAEAVLIHLSRPQDVTDLLEAWANPLHHTQTNEMLRVYYVAITRARKLLTIAYPYSKHAEVSSHLDELKITYQTFAPWGTRHTSA